MDYINLGRSGLKVSRLCLGCMSYGSGEKGWNPWVLGEAESRPFIKEALESGINFFDTANAYSAGASEEVLGRAVKDFAQREDVVVATKIFIPMREGPNAKGLSRKAIVHEIDQSLSRLKTGYIDLLQIHRFDHTTPMEETLEALHRSIEQGKVRYIGGSTMMSWQFAKFLYLADRYSWTRFISMQPHYNLLYREEEREILPLCAEEKIGVIPWSPLARGRLTRSWEELGSTKRGQTDTWGKNLYKGNEEVDKPIVERVGEIANQRGLPRAQIALAWLLGKPVVTAPIVGATKPHHLKDALAALSVKLTPEEIATLEQDYVPHAANLV